MNKNQKLIVGVAIFILLIGAGTFFAVQSRPPVPLAGPPEKVAASDHNIGDPAAKVVLIEFASPTCPHCARWNAEVLPRLQEKYVNSGKVLYVFRIFPRLEDDFLVGRMAACLPREQFFPFIDMMYRNQREWDYEYGVREVPDALVKMGRIAGMSEEQTRGCIRPNKTVDDEILGVASAGAKRYGFNSTPSFVINGEAMPENFFTFEQFDAKIGELLGK